MSYAPPTTMTPGLDPELLYWVRSLDGEPPTSNARVPLTLQMHGSIVSGDLVGAPAYYYLQAKWTVQMFNLNEQRAADTMERGLKQGEHVRNQRTNSLVYMDPEFLHLINAFYLAGSSFMPGAKNSGFVWRGKIKDVSGWNLGKFAP